MAYSPSEWIGHIQRIRGFVGVYLGVDKLSAHQQAALATDLKTLDTDLASLQSSLSAAPTPRPDLPGGDPLSEDSHVASQQILTAIGHPIIVDPDGYTRSVSAETLIADSTPRQIQELALLRWFGNPGDNDVDYGLFERYNAPRSDGSGVWEYKPEYNSIMPSGGWTAYVRATGALVDQVGA